MFQLTPLIPGIATEISPSWLAGCRQGRRSCNWAAWLTALVKSFDQILWRETQSPSAAQPIQGRALSSILHQFCISQPVVTLCTLRISSLENNCQQQPSSQPWARAGNTLWQNPVFPYGTGFPISKPGMFGSSPFPPLGPLYWLVHQCTHISPGITALHSRATPLQSQDLSP